MTPDIDKKECLGDIILSVLVLAGATLLVVGAAGLPEPRFEPLGSAALPRILGTLLYGFGIVVGGRAIVSLWRARSNKSEIGLRLVTSSGLKSLYVFLVLALYVAALDLLQAPFVTASAVFLGLTGFVLSDWDMRAGAIYTVIGFVIAFALSYVFSNFLYISFG